MMTQAEDHKDMTKNVLFVCEDNAILGPMAEAFLKRHGWSTFTPNSAGILARPIHRYTFRVMEEIGYDLYGIFSKNIFEYSPIQRVDFLITLCDSINDHYIFNENHIGNRLHWPFRNPILESRNTPGSPKSGINAWPFFDSYSSEPGYWLTSNDTLLATQRRSEVVLRAYTTEQPQTDMQYILKRFRRTRDEMECQVMNWLEEQGSGPLWWRR